MLKLIYLDDNYEKIFDKMKNMIELGNKIFFRSLLLKGIHRYFPTTCEVFWDVEIKIESLEKGKNLTKQKGHAFWNRTINSK